MFNLGLEEVFIISVIILGVIKPKEIPQFIHLFAKATKKFREILTQIKKSIKIEINND